MGFLRSFRFRYRYPIINGVHIFTEIHFVSTRFENKRDNNMKDNHYF